jgi:hypothetical protein
VPCFVIEITLPVAPETIPDIVVGPEPSIVTWEPMTVLTVPRTESRFPESFLQVWVPLRSRLMAAVALPMVTVPAPFATVIPPVPSVPVLVVPAFDRRVVVPALLNDRPAKPVLAPTKARTSLPPTVELLK